MPAFKSVTVIGGTGYLGKVVVERLVAAGRFNLTVVTRDAASTEKLPSGVATRVADYDSLESLTAAFSGSEVVVCTVPGHLEDLLRRILDAAINAHVKRFIPSEFGFDHRRPAAPSVPIAGSKIKMHAELQPKAAAGLIEYTALVGGPWIEFLLSFEEGLCVSKRKVFIYDTGDLEFGLTTRAAFGDAIVGVLTNPNETKNKILAIEAIRLSQNRILSLIEEALPGEKLEVVHVGLEERYQQAVERLFSGDWSPNTIQVIALRFGFDPEFHPLDEPVNDLLGVKRLTDTDFKNIVKSLA